MFNHRLYATRGFHPTFRTTFSIATRGFSFGIIREYGIRLMSYIRNIFATESSVHTPIELESKI